MMIYNDKFHWDGWGGKLRLGSGLCHLRIFDLSKSGSDAVSLLKPYIIIVSDLPDSKMTVRACSSHIATQVTHSFNIDPGRMLWVEYYENKNRSSRPKDDLVAVDFTWHGDKAVDPKWRTLPDDMYDRIKNLLKKSG